MNTLKEREDAVVNSIMSGNNACGTLARAAAAGDAEFFRRAVRPTILVYEDEARMLREQRDSALRECERRRQALEFVAGNLTLSGDVAAVVGAALGRGVNWKE